MISVKKANGYTLVELMIYLVIAAIVVGIALNMIGVVSSQFVQARTTSKLQGEGRGAIDILARDIKNIGVKYFLRSNTGAIPPFLLDTIVGVTTGQQPTAETGADGRSSFYSGNDISGAVNFDTLTFIKGVLRNDGTFANQVERIQYKVNTARELLRIRDTITNYIAFNAGNGTIPAIEWSTPPDTVVITNNVEALQFQYSYDTKTFIDNPTGLKSAIEAVKIWLLVKTNRTVKLAHGATYEVGTKSITVNDKFLRRLYSETVEVVNNGK